MRVAIMSDTHDNIWRLAEARPRLAQADALLHCGDLCSPFMIPRLAEALAGRPVHVVWGNNDGDRRMIARLAQQAGNVHLHGDFAALELGGLRVALSHYPEVARPLAESGRFDLVCFGHTHRALHERLGTTDLLNPGEMMGLYGRVSFVLYDTDARQPTWVTLDSP